MGTLKLTGKEARTIVGEDHFDWERIEENIIDTTRWSTIYDAVFLHTPTGKHYEFSYSSGSTECQDESPYEYDDFVTAIEVEKKMVQVEKWVLKED